LPLSRLSLSEIRREVIAQGWVAEISGATVWRWLSADALRPWRHRSWIFPRDPDFSTKAGRILDLYDRVWQGRPLNARDFVISADEKSSIQARRRKQPTLAPAPGRCTRVEHEYFREGAWTYLAAWDVHRAKVFGRCEKKSGIAPVDRLIGEVMSQEPYKSARRVFWIMDNCSAHRGQRAVDRLRSQWPNLLLVHTPVHASSSIKLKFTFPLSRERYLHPMTSTPSRNWNSACWPFSDGTSKPLLPFNGPLLAKTWRLSSAKSKTSDSLPPPDARPNTSP
jgi:DDE superfamily endonuclease